ncbi:MAG TPA: hypothetical protein VJV04_09390 [Nitrospiraceae bacterium]|nr:hypothetical protein [Nitrospiraceae bacterium]
MTQRFSPNKRAGVWLLMLFDGINRRLAKEADLDHVRVRPGGTKTIPAVAMVLGHFQLADMSEPSSGDCGEGIMIPGDDSGRSHLL